MLSKELVAAVEVRQGERSLIGESAVAQEVVSESHEGIGAEVMIVTEIEMEERYLKCLGGLVVGVGKGRGSLLAGTSHWSHVGATSKVSRRLCDRYYD